MDMYVFIYIKINVHIHNLIISKACVKILNILSHKNFIKFYISKYHSLIVNKKMFQKPFVSSKILLNIPYSLIK